MTAYTMGKTDFGRALQQVGREGSVARSVPGCFFKEFSDCIYDNINNFSAGEADIFKIAGELKEKWNYKAPISYVSKIAHIINPWEYSLIWDNNVRTILHIGEHDEKAFKAQNELYKEKVKGLPREEAYRPDANIWAQVVSN